ncbi:MAG: hypothetical protein ACXWP4_10895 [Polyangiales bacterium]
MRSAGCGIAVLMLSTACGARTGPHVDEPPAETSVVDSSSSETSAVDSAIEDTAVDTAPDAILSDVGCMTDAECDDKIDCTEDRCDLSVGLCRHAPFDVRCDDGLFCTGVERCDLAKGCVTTPRNCADPIACTHDLCDEATNSCVHDPDDALCPVSHVCDPVLGCQARAIAHSQTDLYEIRLPSGIVKKIGPTTMKLTDVALQPDGTFYGIDFTSICALDIKTGSCTGASVPVSGNIVGLDSAPDGRLFGAGDTRVYVIDPKTGLETAVATLPTGLTASGDIAFVGTRMLVTARGGLSDILVEIDPKTGAGKSLGNIGYSCVWGLAGYGPTLYGLTCEGRVLRIDPVTGKGTQLTKVDVKFWGATAR